MISSKGLKFKKFDLHVHTPASDDFEDKKATPEDIVNTAHSMGLTGIAITDHQTAEWIDRVKDAVKGKDLVVFPGVELMATGGERGVHVLAIFDVDKDSNHVNQFLHTIQIYEKSGEKSVATENTVGQIADELERYDPSALLILPHCRSSKGVAGDIKGETRTLIFDKRRKCLLGAEADEADFLNEDRKKAHKRLIDCFDGTDPEYHCRELGVYQSSDAHSLLEIGKKFTYFKVDEPITIEDIRQALTDRDTRIRQSFEYKEQIYPHIDSLKIKGGFLDDEELEFHEGLNSILGAKGSGKSLVIEFLRFVLNQPPQSDELRNDHDSKLEKCLKLHGEVEVTFTDESDKKYLLKRTHNPEEDNPIEIIDLSDRSKKEFQIEQVFPVLFISQNEVIKIAEDRSGESQRKFIDRFFDFYKYQQEIEGLNKDLTEIDNKFADSLKAHLETLNLNRRIVTYKEEIEKLERQIQSSIFEKYSKKEKIGLSIKSQLDFLDSMKESLQITESEYKDMVFTDIDDEDANSDPAVKRSLDVTRETIKQVVANIRNAISILDQKRKKIDQEYRDWERSFESVKAEYDKMVREAGGAQVVLDQKRKKLMNERSEIEKTLTRYQGKAQQIGNIADRRNEIVQQLEEVYKKYFEERKDRCDYFTAHSKGSLNVTIREREDKSAFRENLLKFKRGTWLKDEEIRVISDTVPPKEFIDNVLRYEWKERKERKYLGEISKKTDIDIENVEKLAQHLLDEYEYANILTLLYTSIPKDVPSIGYKVGDGFKTLDELSVGQKAIALLIIALSEGSFPIVIDQPEDSLDLRTIWEDVCKKLRGSKDRRQFIFTTHNSSVAVASDSDSFTILQADANHGKVLYSGSMNRENIKKEVVNYLEGGEATYDKKRRKYSV